MTINITYEGTEYTLTYTRETVQKLEAKGVYAADIEKKPMTILPALFEGAFLANHPNVSKKTILTIFDMCGNKEELIEAIAEMYNQPFQELVSGTNGESKATWKATF